MNIPVCTSFIQEILKLSQINPEGTMKAHIWGRSERELRQKGLSIYNQPATESFSAVSDQAYQINKARRQRLTVRMPSV